MKTVRCRCKLQSIRIEISKFRLTAASRGSPCDSTASCIYSQWKSITSILLAFLSTCADCKLLVVFNVADSRHSTALFCVILAAGTPPARRHVSRTTAEARRKWINFSILSAGYDSADSWAAGNDRRTPATQCFIDRQSHVPWPPAAGLYLSLGYGRS